MNNSELNDLIRFVFTFICCVSWWVNIQRHIFSYPILSYPILSYPILSYPILSYPILSYHIISHYITQHNITPHHTSESSISRWNKESNSFLTNHDQTERHQSALKSYHGSQCTVWSERTYLRNGTTRFTRMSVQSVPYTKVRQWNLIVRVMYSSCIYFVVTERNLGMA